MTKSQKQCDQINRKKPGKKRCFIKTAKSLPGFFPSVDPPNNPEKASFGRFHLSDQNHLYQKDFVEAGTLGDSKKH